VTGGIFRNGISHMPEHCVFSFGSISYNTILTWNTSLKGFIYMRTVVLAISQLLISVLLSWNLLQPFLVPISTVYRMII